MTQKEKMIAGELYNAADAELTELRARARLIFDEYNSTSVSELEQRKELIKKLFGGTGDKFYVEPSFKCDYGFNIYVGENFYANFDCVFLEKCRITVGNNSRRWGFIPLRTRLTPP